MLQKQILNLYDKAPCLLVWPITKMFWFSHSWPYLWMIVAYSHGHIYGWLLHTVKTIFMDDCCIQSWPYLWMIVAYSQNHIYGWLLQTVMAIFMDDSCKRSYILLFHRMFIINSHGYLFKFKTICWKFISVWILYKFLVSFFFYETFLCYLCSFDWRKITLTLTLLYFFFICNRLKKKKRSRSVLILFLF